MDNRSRNQKILRIIEEATERGTRSRQAARSMLIAEGIYNEDGSLHRDFGGESADPGDEGT